MQRIHLLFAFLATMSAWSQGIQIDCGYPNESCYRQLTIEDIDKSSTLINSTFTGNDAYTKFKDQGLWNQPAAYRTGITGETYFNYFASLVPNAFIPIKAGDYQMLNHNKYDQKGWYTGGKLIGNNQITYTNSGNNPYTLNQNLPIWVVKTEQQFYREFCQGRTYDDLLKSCEKEDGIGKAEGYISNEFSRQLYNNTLKDNFKFNSYYTVDFKDSSYTINDRSISIQEPFSSVFQKGLMQIIKTWADDKYLKSTSGFRIATNKEFSISLTKMTETKYDTYEKGLTLFTSLSSAINDEYKIPKNTPIKFSHTTIELRVNSRIDTIENATTLIRVSPIRIWNLSDIKTFLGCAHTSVLKKPKSIVIGLTIGSMSSFALSWVARNLLYQSYLKSPQDRNVQYNWANGFNKAMIISAIPYSLGVAIDLKLTHGIRNKINSSLAKEPRY